METWEKLLSRWSAEGLVDIPTADRIRAFEAARGKSEGYRWPVLLAVAFGAVMLMAGILLFVAAHWDELAPSARFMLVLLMTALFHSAAAMTVERFKNLATALHGIGTVALGAGVYLGAQVFNLQEHWPTGVLLWAVGAWIGYALLRDWVQLTLAAVLTPAWLVSEWQAYAQPSGRESLAVSEGLLLLAIVYLGAVGAEKTGVNRKALAWVGGLSLIPCTLWVILAGHYSIYRNLPPSTGLTVFAWFIAFALPLSVAVMLQSRDAWLNILPPIWVAVLGTMAGPQSANEGFIDYVWRVFGPYLWCAVGSMALAAWGLREGRKERINLGVAGFGLTVCAFYFSSVMDMLGRSASLIGFGVIFLLGGWVLEKGRRRLIARLERREA